MKTESVDVPGITRPMTYEEYLAGPEEMARYDILDGWKVYRLYGDNLLPSPTRRHQRILGRLLHRFQDYEAESGTGEAIAAPCDVQITYQPLRSRQPDLLFISRERLAQNDAPDECTPPSPAPELVVEIISPSDTPSVLTRKLEDYRAVDVQEIWLVDPKTTQITVIPARISEDVTAYGPGQAAVSTVFPSLYVVVNDIFTQE